MDFESKSVRRNRPGMAFVWAVLALVCVAEPGRLFAQQSPLLSGLNQLGNSHGGFQLYNVTGHAGWQSVANPEGGYVHYGTGVGADEIFGASAALGWSRRGAKSNLFLTYSGGYEGYVRYSNLRGFNHYLSFSANRQLGRKWGLSFSNTSAISTYNRMLFSPTVFGSLVAIPGTFDDLAAAVLAGKYSNDQFASLLTGVPVIESPARTLFFGNRVFTSSASTSLGYAHSQRLSISFTASASRIQHLNFGHEQPIPQYAYLVPSALTGTAGVGVSYALTPRTQLGITATSERAFSRIEQSYVTNGTAYVGRTMGRHWFAQVHAGAGFVTSVRSTYPGRLGEVPIYGASLGYKRYAHSFLVAHNRTLSQSYGVGASNMNTTSAAWQWSRPGRSWGLMSEYMRERSTGGVFGTFDGWRVGAGLTRNLGRHTMLETSYTYASYSSRATPSQFNSAQSGVQLAVVWMPHGEGR